MIKWQIFTKIEQQHRLQLVRTEQEMITLRSENAKLNGVLKYERECRKNHEDKIKNKDQQIDALKNQLDERERMIKDLQIQNNQRHRMLADLQMEQERSKRRYQRAAEEEAEKRSRQLAEEHKRREHEMNVSILASVEII